MSLLRDLLGNLGKKSDKKSDNSGFSLEDASNVLGAIGGNKKDQKELADKAKDLIPGTIDDTIIETAEKQFGLTKDKK